MLKVAMTEPRDTDSEDRRLARETAWYFCAGVAADVQRTADMVEAIARGLGVVR